MKQSTWKERVCAVCSKGCSFLCPDCRAVFDASPENRKITEIGPNNGLPYMMNDRQMGFQMDFVNRIRAERLNAGNGT